MPETWTPLVIISRNINGDILLTTPNGSYCLTFENYKVIDGKKKWDKMPKKMYDEILKHLNNG